MEIVVLTGPKRSGKTSLLMDLVDGNKTVGGFLSPVVEGKRYFFHPHSLARMPMEASENEENPLKVGRFTFSKSAFDWASACLCTDWNLSQLEWIVLDEIGPLELRGEGFCALLHPLLQDQKSNKNLLIVVRNELVASAIEAFGLNRFSVRIVDIQNPEPLLALLPPQSTLPPG